MILALALLLAGQDADLETLRLRVAAEAQLPALLRTGALVALGDLKSDPAAEILAGLLEKDPDEAVRIAAARALAVNRRPGALKALAAAARSDSAPAAVRIAALQGLTAPPSPEGLSACRALLRAPGELRQFAWAGLRRYPLNKDLENVWRGALNNDEAFVRALAISALAPLKEVALQDLARKALHDPSEDLLVRYASVAVHREAGGIASARVLVAAAAVQPDTTLRRLLSEALGTFADDKSAAEIYTGLKHPDPVVRAVLARSLGRLRHPQAGDRLAGPLKDPVLDVRASALEAVAERHDKSSETVLLREAQGTNEEAAGIAISLLPAYPTEAVRAALVKLSGNAKASLSVPALDALGELGGAETYPVFEKALKARDWAVRVSAVRGLKRLRTKEALDLLVERMGQEEGRLLADIGDALRALTGQRFENGAGQWKEWWTRARDSFEFPSAGAPPPGPLPGMTTYHGIPVVSTRIVFCLDVSGSMSAPSSEGTRLEHAKKELLRALGQMGKDAQANIVFFDDRIEPWFQKLAAVKANLRAAQELLAKLQPRGQTNIFDAIEAALAHKDADTIYLLSDGEPSHGRITDPEDILREVRRLNRLRKAVIHTISFGGSPFLKALAEENGGKYVEAQ